MKRLLLAVILVIAPTLGAATLHGRVLDKAGHAIKGVSIGGGKTVSSDRKGLFELADVPSDAPLELAISKDGYKTQRLIVAAADLEKRLEVVLEPGFTVNGRVVLENGTPVADIVVTSMATSFNGESMGVPTDENGRFEFLELTPRRYDFIVGEGGDAVIGSVRDVVVDRAKEIAIHATRLPSGIVSGRITDMHRFTEGLVSLDAPASDWIVKADADGTFRMEGVPAGSKKISAVVFDKDDRRREIIRTIDVVAGKETKVDFDFAPQRVLHGHATRRGAPLVGFIVRFAGKTCAWATTNQRGDYEVQVEPGHYAITVQTITDGYLPFRGEVDVERDSVLDVALDTTDVHVHAVDAETGRPIRDVYVGEDGPNESVAYPVRTAADGSAVVEVAKLPATIMALADDYAEERVEAAAGEVTIKLHRAVPLIARVVDARDGVALEAQLVIRDAQGNVVPTFQLDANDDTIQFFVVPGEYGISASVKGYGTQTLRVVAPSADEIRFALTRAESSN